MKSILGFIIAGVLSTTIVLGQDIAGDWHGTLHTGGPDLQLVLHISKGADGSLSSTLDSVDQGANGIPVNSTTLQNSNLKLVIDAVHGTYEGKVSSDGNSIAGTWSQDKPLPLEFKRGGLSKAEHKPAKPSDIDGAWMGTLDMGAAKLRLVYHILNTQDGLTATADSPDQGAKGIPVSKVTRNGPSLKLEISALNAVFDGKIANDLKSISGTFTQQGNTVPLVLTRVNDQSQLERHRPQTPAKPYPYHDEEVAYENRAQNVRLAATLTVPQGQGPFPAVLLITGSGPQDRDETLMQHRPFLVLADYLTRRGVAVLRADDRGVGKSTGSFDTATTADFATDAESGIAYLKTRTEIDPHKIGLIGHSEGGVIAPMVAARNHDVAFIVLMAGTGVRGDQLLPEQVAAILEASGKSHDEAEKAARQEREILAFAEQQKDDALVGKKIQEITEGKLPDAQIGAQVKQIRSPWFLYFMQYDPAVALSRVKCPVLAINGEKDTQVLAKQNLPAIRKALETGGNTHFEIVELPGLNHLFQTAKTGSPAEYVEIEETVSPVALDKICGWILKQASI
jgi:pimeloyl-ACP methyl ester carboxylesterase